MKWIILLSCLLAGCVVTPQQKYENMVRAYGPTCEAFGFTPETDPYRQCLLSQRNKAISAYGVVTR